MPARSSVRAGLWTWGGAAAGLLLLAGCASPPATTSLSAADRATAAVGSPAGDRAYAAPLTGLGPKDLVTLLGEPDLRRSDPPAELWQYRGVGCVLELYLYREGDVYRVVRSETRGRLLGDEACTAPPHAVPASVRQSRLQPQPLF